MVTGDFMIIRYDKEKLISALRDFSNATGININLIDKDGHTQILWNDYKDHCDIPSYCRIIHSLPQSRNKCHASDSMLIERCKKSLKAEHHICHAGLVDIAVPITHNDSVLGYIILGQMKKETDFKKVYPLIAHTGLPMEEMKKSFDALPTYDDSKIKGVISVAVRLTKYILTENMVKTKSGQKLDILTEYIDAHLGEVLTPDSISKGTYLSKTTLYKLTNRHFGMALGEYINLKKLDKSLELLEKADLSIEEVATSSGFSGASYYGKLFKKYKGISPTAYRKKLTL